ncbi:MAG TPA: hypothetical protein VMV90_16415 [Rectinemataceae bacterium]|nr:hypothetical protein [Rectinemataceae bacterium]
MKTSLFTASIASFVAPRNTENDVPSSSWDLDPDLPNWERHPNLKTSLGWVPGKLVLFGGRQV